MLGLLVPALLLAASVVGVAALIVQAQRPSESTSPFAPSPGNGFAALDTGHGAVDAPSSGAAPVASGGIDAIVVPAGLLGPADPRAARKVQNFSCDSATASPARQLVCNHWELATVDYNLALAYRHALAAVPNPAALRREQRGWLQALDRQREATRILQHYQARLERLSKPAA
ncbi:MAG: hypothetical protein A4S16_11635 [Proteobacteria bacterium SG_bin6]|nr:MAG: hypothetical protein A4S16_11635 [Proteobacteria bacterium SG_bin6]